MIRPFELHRPTTIAEASGLLMTLPESALYRGGTELLQVMKLGLARFAHLIDLKRIPALHGITTDEAGSIRIAAGTVHHEIERSTAVRAAWPALAELERHVANPRVRSIGSIGGNLCFAEPHSDPAALLLAADARLELEGAAGRRTIAVDDFILGPLESDVAPGELLTAIVLPAPAAGMTLAYRRLALAERPTASVACRLTVLHGVVVEVRLAVGAIGVRPVLATVASAALTGVPVTDLEEAIRVASPLVGQACEVVDEPGASAEYRRHLAGVLAGRAVRAATELMA